MSEEVTGDAIQDEREPALGPPGGQGLSGGRAGGEQQALLHAGPLQLRVQPLVTVSDGPSSLETDDDRDIGWEYPAFILVVVIMSVVVIGVREWIKEIKKPLRPW